MADPPKGCRGWIGLAAVGASAFVIDETTAWPSYRALLPVLGTAAMIVAGATPSRAGTSAALSWRPLVWIGGLSYSLYLWHWPLLVGAREIWGEIGTRWGLLLMALAFIPAWLSLRLLEDPVRFSQRLTRSHPLTLSFGLNCTLVGVGAGTVLALSLPSSPATPNVTAAGARSLAQTSAPMSALPDIDWFVPAAVAAPDDLPPARARGCHADQLTADPVLCEYGDAGSDTRVIVTGDSKIFQWDSALRSIAQDRGWHVLSFTKSACSFSSARQSIEGRAYDSCIDWNSAVMERVIEADPDLVITSGRSTRALGRDGELSSDAMVAGLATAWQEITRAGIPVAVLLDTPAPPFQVYECAAENRDDLSTCAFDRDQALASSAADIQLQAASQVDGEVVVDMNDAICPEPTCAPVIGNVLVYRQGSHVTDTYVRTLVDRLDELLVPLVDESTAD